MHSSTVYFYNNGPSRLYFAGAASPVRVFFLFDLTWSKPPSPWVVTPPPPRDSMSGVVAGRVELLQGEWEQGKHEWAGEQRVCCVFLLSKLKIQVNWIEIVTIGKYPETRRVQRDFLLRATWLDMITNGSWSIEKENVMFYLSEVILSVMIEYHLSNGKMKHFSRQSIDGRYCPEGLWLLCSHWEISSWLWAIWTTSRLFGYSPFIIHMEVAADFLENNKKEKH